MNLYNHPRGVACLEAKYLESKVGRNFLVTKTPTPKSTEEKIAKYYLRSKIVSNYLSDCSIN